MNLNQPQRQLPIAPQALHPAPLTPNAPSTPLAPAVAVQEPPSLLDKPAEPAKVTLTGGQLSVDANNSSLTDILHQLASSSGMSIEGLHEDTRVFGAYGPGDPRDILSALLDDAGYNVLMLGTTDVGAPRQLILTTRSNGPDSAPAVQQNMAQHEDDQDDNVPPPSPAGEAISAPPTPPQVPVSQQNPNGTPRTPQQMLQELQQMRMQQQQQQQQQNPQ